MLSRVYKGNVTISLAASEPVSVGFKEAIMRNGAQYRTVESHVARARKLSQTSNRSHGRRIW
jgi:hypothetical protein